MLDIKIVAVFLPWEGLAGLQWLTEKEHTWVLCIDIFYILIRECLQGFSGSGGKESTCNVGDLGSIPGKIPWRRACQLTPVYLPGESHGQRSLAEYSPQGCKESDTILPLNNSKHSWGDFVYPLKKGSVSHAW